MIPAPTNKSKKTDTTLKSHVSVSDAPVLDSIVPTILEPSSLADDFAETSNIMKRLDSKVDNYIQRLNTLESNIVHLLQTSDPLLLSLPAEIE